MLSVSPGPTFFASTTSLFDMEQKERDKEPLQPMSNAVLLNRYWKLSASVFPDYKLFGLAIDFLVKLMRFGLVIDAVPQIRTALSVTINASRLLNNSVD